MADHIPFVTGEEACRLVTSVYRDSGLARVPLDRVDKLRPLLPKTLKMWLDPCVDGMHDIASRGSRTWFKLMRGFPHHEKIGDSSFQGRPVKANVDAFVQAVLDKCAEAKPAWITVPQLPLVKDSRRNAINKQLAAATGRWRVASGFSGSLILPLVVTNQNQVNGKVARNPKVTQATRCYHEAQADGFWVVDQSLRDDSGSSTLTRKRFPGIISFHEELNSAIVSSIRIGGPYWGLNLVLWARRLVDYPAIGVGSGYRYLIAGGYAKPAKVRLAVPSLRRRIGVGARARKWLEAAVQELASSHPACSEINQLMAQYTVLSAAANARRQVAEFYKLWFDTIAGVPAAGRSMAMFQDLSAAYALGKSLPELKDEGTARRPEAIAQSLMLSCL